MANLIELLQAKHKHASNPRTLLGTDATTQRLHSVVTRCSACQQSLDGHSYRFFSCHPVASSDHFVAAVHRGDWPVVQTSQLPSIHQPSFVVYAIGCPASLDSSGMVAMVLADGDATTAHQLSFATPLSPDDFADLRDLCPTCLWISFGPALQSGQEIV